MDEIAWAAGLFEGEGSARVTSSGRPSLRVKMTREDSVLRFAKAVGAGKVYGPYENRMDDGYPRSPFWTWIAEGPAAIAVAALLWPHLTQWRRDGALGEMEVSAGSGT